MGRVWLGVAAVGVGLTALILVSRSAKAASEGLARIEWASEYQGELDRCGTDRACRESIREAFEGGERRYIPYEEMAEIQVARRAAEEARIRRLREEMWSHL